MKKLRRVLLFLLLVPICFGFSACKKSGDTDDAGNTPPTEQNPGGDATPNGTYTVNFDYNLPEDYEFLLSDYSITKEVGASADLVSPSSAKLSEHFEGWQKDGEGETLTGSVSGSAGEVINLKGKWNENNLRKFYYSDGLSFDLSSGSAKVISYTGSSSTVILPKDFKNSSINYNVNKIGDSVFENNKNINKLIINSDSLAIGNSAFKNTNISNFEFDKVTQIGDYAFENTKFTSVTLNSKVNFLGSGAFKNCENLTSFDFNGADLEYSVTDNGTSTKIEQLGVSNEAFSGCILLKTLSNTSNLKGIGVSAFSGCVALENTDFLGDKITSIGINAFKDCAGLTSANIPAGVTSINGEIFSGCENISELKIGYIYLFNEAEDRSDDTLIHHLWGEDDEGSHRSIKSVTKIVITGNKVTTLYENYFLGFDNLTTFVMSNSITKIKDYTFNGCSKLENITFSNNIDINGFTHLALYGTKYLNDLDEPWLLNDDKILFFVPKEKLSAEYKNWEIPSTVTTIKADVFAGNEIIETIKIPSSVTIIEDGAFSCCPNLLSVEFETNSNLTSLSKNLFSQCTKLQTITGITNLQALTSIKQGTFAYTKVSIFTIPSTVTQIDEGAFANSQITKFEMSGENPYYSVENDVLYETKNSEKILLAYPSKKTDEFFLCPSGVTKFASESFAFGGLGDNVNLKYICFNTNSMLWGETSDVNGPYKNVFTHKFAFICLGDTINYTGVAMDYYSSITGVNYNGSKIVFESEFNADTEPGLYFIKKQLNEQDTISIIIFELEKNGDSLQVKEGSCKVFSTDLVS